MAFPTTNVRIEAGPFGFFAKGCHFDTPPESRLQWTGYFAAQEHKFAGIGPVDGRDGAGATQVALPGGAK